jgi:uncharacterized membrane-anchored protein
MEDLRHVTLADVRRVLKRLAETEERLALSEEREGNDTEALMHEHGAMVLREALNLLRFGADE